MLIVPKACALRKEIRRKQAEQAKPGKRKLPSPMRQRGACNDWFCYLLYFFFLPAAIIPITALPLMSSRATRRIMLLLSPV